MSARLHRLNNGLQVAVDPIPELETLSLSVVARGGARWEDAARSGWSHLLEHMVFKGAAGRDARALVEAMARALGAERPAPVVLMLESPPPQGFGPRPAPLPVQVSNRHLGYAVTWFGLAAALVGVWLAYVLRKPRTA